MVKEKHVNPDVGDGLLLDVREISLFELLDHDKRVKFPTKRWNGSSTQTCAATLTALAQASKVCRGN